MRKKMIFFIFMILFLIFIKQSYTFAYEDSNIDIGKDILDSQMDMLDLNEIDELINSFVTIERISIKDLSIKAVTGQLDLSPQNIIQTIVSGFTSEFREITVLVKNMILITILTALLKSLSASFTQKSVNELSFYINYMVVIIILISSFNVCVNVMYELIDWLCLFMKASLPTMLTLMIASGKITSTYLFSSIVLFFISLISNLIRNIIVPIIILSATLQLINYISEKELLNKMSELIKNSINWTLKTVIILFISILSIQGISSPIINNIATKSMKSALNLVPVVGGTLSGAVDTVASWTGAMKSGFMIAIIITIIFVCAVPILKLVSFMIIFKITSAIIQPICDERIVEAIDSLGSYVGILIGACSAIAFMFVFMVIILLGVV